MRGEPKNLNSKADYLYAKEHFEPDYWLPRYKALIETAFDWFYDKELNNAEEGIVDATHKVVEEEGLKSSNYGDYVVDKHYYQYVYTFNETSELARLGFTFGELFDAIWEVEPSYKIPGV